MPSGRSLRTIGKGSVLFVGGGVSACLGLAEAVEEESIIGDSFFDELLEEEQLGAINYRMDALLEGLHGGESLIGVAEEDGGRMAALAHRHMLQGLQRQVFTDFVSGEQFLDNDDLITNLAETDQKIAMGGGCMDFVAQLGERSFGGIAFTCPL